VAPGDGALRVIVLVVHVVFMLMVVFQRFMPMHMPVLLAEVQPDTQRHQHAGNEHHRHSH
jgi:hypothetical protein